jgi:ATP-dependent protease HslVU (ClpYQ) peptidase subunit
VTTIVYRDRVLAADRQITFGNVCDAEMSKIGKRIEDGTIFGVTGMSLDAYKLLQWALNGAYPSDRPTLSDNCNMLEIRRDQTMWLHMKEGSIPISAPYYACGSGAEIALGALAMGATAVQAVHIAADHDAYTNHNVEILRLN